MNFIQRISPGHISADSERKGELFILREKILQTILLILSVLGIPTVILASIKGIVTHDQTLPVMYTAIYLFVFAMMFGRELPYRLRANTLTLMVYLLALSELFESGQLGDVRMFLIAFTSMVAVLFGYRSVIAAILLSLVTIAGTGIYAAITPNPIFPALANLRDGSGWLVGSVTFLMIAVMISGSINIIINGLSANLARQGELRRRLEAERDALEDRVEQRTHDMARRIAQLRAATEISRTISALSDPDTFLQQIVDLMKERFDLYYAGIFLLEPSGQFAVLRAGSGAAGKRMVAQGHQLAVGGSSMIGWSIANRKSQIAYDAGLQAVRFNNPNLPLTRSEIAQPIIAHDVVLGAITIQSDLTYAFDENDITVFEGIADSLAIALENDRLYQEARKSLEEIRALNREYIQLAWAEAIETYGELAYQYENRTVSERTSSEGSNAVEVPLVLRDEVIGSVVLEIDRPGLSEEETSFVENVTTQTAIALENARLLHETERRAIQEEKLNQLASRFSRAMSIDEILRAAVQDLGQLPAVSEVTVQLAPAGQPNRAPAAGGNGKEPGK